MNHHVILSGCSGGGKSTLLNALRDRGFNTIEEPGRRIVAEEIRRGGDKLPWLNLEGFARRAVELSLQDIALASQTDSWTFFDRGLLDAICALQFCTGESEVTDLINEHRFYPTVFLTPPWPTLFETDDARQHTLSDATEEYERLIMFYPRHGYEPYILPKTSVTERADLVLQRLAILSPG